LLGLAPTPAAADRDAPFTVERVKFEESTAKAFRRNCELDQMREVPFVRKADEQPPRMQSFPFPTARSACFIAWKVPSIGSKISAPRTRGRATVKLDADFAKVVTLNGYRVFLTREGDCQSLYVRKRGSRFEVRELQGGISNVAFSYRIVAKRKDIKRHTRFAKIDTPRPNAQGRGTRRPSAEDYTKAIIKACAGRSPREGCAQEGYLARFPCAPRPRQR
jgi:hypothetical protein